MSAPVTRNGSYTTAGRRGYHWPRAAVFDCDGLLVDSAGCWEHAYAATARSLGRSLDRVDLRALLGASVTAAATSLSIDFDDDVDPAALRRTLHTAVTNAALRPMPGAHTIVNALAERIPLAVASNGPAEIVARMLEIVQLRHLFQAIVSAEDTPADKPAPDVYREACRRLSTHPSDAIAFEDSPRGALAARAAGILVVAVPSTPGLRIDADFTARRLDDRKLLSMLHLRAS